MSILEALQIFVMLFCELLSFLIIFCQICLHYRQVFAELIDLAFSLLIDVLIMPDAIPIVK